MAWLDAVDFIDDWIGDDPPTDEGLVAKWIGKAERLLRREFPTLKQRLEAADADPDLQGTVEDVLSAMVARVFRNPEGIRQRQETDGSFTGSITFSGDSPGTLFLTDGERDALREPGSVGSGQAFSISMNGSGYSQHLLWCDRTWVDGRCSCGASIAGRPIYELG